MSILACDECGQWIDTDDCPDAYCEEEDAWYCYICMPDPGDPEPAPCNATRIGHKDDENSA